MSGLCDDRTSFFEEIEQKSPPNYKEYLLTPQCENGTETNLRKAEIYIGRERYSLIPWWYYNYDVEDLIDDISSCKIKRLTCQYLFELTLFWFLCVTCCITVMSFAAVIVCWFLADIVLKDATTQETQARTEFLLRGAYEMMLQEQETASWEGWSDR